MFYDADRPRRLEVLNACILHLKDGRSRVPRRKSTNRSTRTAKACYLRVNPEAFVSKLLSAASMESVPKHDDVSDHAECAELVLLASTVTLAQLAASSMENRAKLVATFTTVQLIQCAPSFIDSSSI